MFLNLFREMKSAKIPVSLREYLTFIEALTAGVAIFDVNEFYFLARSALVKDERHIDRFDQVFSHVFKGLEKIQLEEVFKKIQIPDEWIKRLAEVPLHHTYHPRCSQAHISIMEQHVCGGAPYQTCHSRCNQNSNFDIMESRPWIVFCRESSL